MISPQGAHSFIKLKCLIQARGTEEPWASFIFMNPSGIILFNLAQEYQNSIWIKCQMVFEIPWIQKLKIDQAVPGQRQALGWDVSLQGRDCGSKKCKWPHKRVLSHYRRSGQTVSMYLLKPDLKPLWASQPQWSQIEQGHLAQMLRRNQRSLLPWTCLLSKPER